MNQIAQRIDGKKLSETVHAEIAAEVRRLKEERNLTPGLAVVLVGEHEASKIYVRNKQAACQKVGMFAEQHNLPATATEEEVLHLIYTLNHDPKIHGILVQLPLPAQIREQKILEALDPKKDVDGFHPVNMGYLLMGKPQLVPCTPLGIMRMLDSISEPIEGKHAVVVGRSNIVGKPISLLLLQRNATVTLCHSKTEDLPGTISRADIVIAAVGQPEMIRGSWIKKGAVVIDVGINRVTEKLKGDVDFEGASTRASFITPVPGGVGPMTIAMLLSNTLQASKKLIQ